MKDTRFYALDGLRGIFALTVLLNHAIQSVTGWKNDGPFSGPHLSVAYFFIISGFVLTHSHGKNDGFVKYLLTRFARLWPLTFISVVAMVLTYAILNFSGDGYVPGDYVFNANLIIKNILFIHGATPFKFHLINPPTWTIGIEFWASLFIPLVFVRMDAILRLCSSIALFILLFYVSKTGMEKLDSLLLFGMHNLLFAIASMMLGSSIYSVLERKSDKISNNSKHIEVFMWTSFATCMIGIYAQTSFVNRLDFFFIISFAPILMVDYLSENSFIKKFTRCEIVQFFGYISFPLYLLHFPILITGIAYRGSDNVWLGVLMMCSVSIVVAYLYTAFVDVRMYRYLKGCINALLPDKPPTVEKNKEA
ncbi:hypothetical protein BTJ39_09275 [Izhakiella australiensis]|uniref:Acyltransferase 3 domain-containing protein n=2 Tax=Izhakiella australiensis TaxID=1926881 RepID=A0A1S8YN44_9GAMM|nr:hypothetical protein BTJ39_09275 [Izhakiella australiensis]